MGSLFHIVKIFAYAVNVFLFATATVFIMMLLIIKIRGEVLAPVQLSSDIVYTLLGVAIIVAAVSFVGCWGVISESKVLIGSHAIFMITIILTELVLAIYVYHRKESIRQDLEYRVRTEIQHFNQSNVAWHINNFQRKHNCCGLVGISDWHNFTNFIPGSCCNKSNSEVCSTDTEYAEANSKPGCKMEIEKQIQKFKEGLPVMLAILLLILIIEIVLVAFTICIFLTPDEDKLSHEEDEGSPNSAKNSAEKKENLKS